MNTHDTNPCPWDAPDWRDELSLVKIAQQEGLSALTSRERLRLAQSWGTPDEIALDLAKGGDPEVEEAIARNVMAPPAVLEELAREDGADHRWEIQRAVACNPGCPPELLRHLERHGEQ